MTMAKGNDSERTQQGCSYPRCGTGLELKVLSEQVGILTNLQRDHANWQRDFWEGQVDLGKIGEAVDMMKDMFTKNDDAHQQMFDRLRIVEANYVKDTELETVKNDVVAVKGGFVSKRDIIILAAAFTVVLGAIQVASAVYTMKSALAAITGAGG